MCVYVCMCVCMYVCMCVCVRTYNHNISLTQKVKQTVCNWTSKCFDNTEYSTVC